MCPSDSVVHVVRGERRRGVGRIGESYISLPTLALSELSIVKRVV